MMLKNRNHLNLFIRLKQLGTVCSVLHVAAHPDDEDIGLLAYVSYKHYGRAVYWSATRGENGQNIANAYKGKALGVYRTWESMAAREVDGGECLFGPFIDYGYSKNAEEALSKWDKENMSRELVRAIRLVQPQVVVSRWSGNADDMHGHHQAVGQAVSEAFERASDPKSFPELLKEGLAPWFPLKLYCSLNNNPTDMSAAVGGNISGRFNPQFEKDGVLRINAGEFDPLHGQTYQELAFKAYNSHKTQGMGILPEPDNFYYYFHLLRSRIPIPARETDLFTGIDRSLTGLASGVETFSQGIKGALEAVKKYVSAASELFRPGEPCLASNPLFEGLKILNSLRQSLSEEKLPRHTQQALALALDRKIYAFEEVIAACLGLRLEAVCTRGKVTPGESLWMSTRIWNPKTVSFEQSSLKVCLPKGWKAEPVEVPPQSNTHGVPIALYEVFIENEAELSTPYWLSSPETPYVYKWPNGHTSQQPLTPPPVQVQCHVSINGQDLTLRTSALHRKAFPGGYSELPPAVVCPISLHPESRNKFFLVSDPIKRLELQVTARCNDEERPAEGQLELAIPHGWEVTPQRINLSLTQGGGTRTCAFSVTIPKEITEGRYTLQYRIRCRGRDYGVILTPVQMGLPGLPDQVSSPVKEEFILEPAQVTVHMIDAHFVKDRCYAYIEGLKEDVLSTLEAMGIKFHSLTDHEIEHRRLEDFNTIVIGPRAYTIRESLRENGHRFLEYMKKGGTLVVQYQWYGYDRGNLAPYPFRFDHPVSRVTDEQASVHISSPENRLFHSPNAICRNDFDGWVHDRGLAFFSQWDQKYTIYLSCADPGEPQQEGGLIGCRYGMGSYLYVGYSIFRQLPVGVPGAFRLFFNMLVGLE